MSLARLFRFVSAIFGVADIMWMFVCVCASGCEPDDLISKAAAAGICLRLQFMPLISPVSVYANSRHERDRFSPGTTTAVERQSVNCIYNDTVLAQHFSAKFEMMSRCGRDKDRIREQRQHRAFLPGLMGDLSTVAAVAVVAAAAMVPRL